MKSSGTFAAGCIALLMCWQVLSAALLWQIGTINNSSGEFVDYSAGSATYNVTAATNFPKGLKASVNPAITLNYNLITIPVNGVTFITKTVTADLSVPQLAVYSNGIFAGMIQIIGVGRTNCVYKYQKTYQLYIPKELLLVGPNTLKLEASRYMYCSAASDQFNSWEWDYIRLDSRDQPAHEPIHGRYESICVQFGFFADATMYTLIKPMATYCGIAYSGNIMRTPFWQDVQSSWDGNGAATQAFNALRDINMGACDDYMAEGKATTDANGNLDASHQQATSAMLTKYGSMFQMIEVSNEPGLFGDALSVNIAYAKYLRQVVPQLAPHLKIESPGWAFSASGGTPSGWEANPASRYQIEQYCDYMGGHSYGCSYIDNTGGSLTENLRTYGSKGLLTGEGFPKVFHATEMGTMDGHYDDAAYGSSQQHASVFDRIVRAHLAFADMQNIFVYNDPSFMNFAVFSNNNPDAYAGVNGEDPRLKAIRRLACAYATHGTPLTYTYTNAAAITGKKAYFRGVNTATLMPLAGTNASSNKVLLNFVNFESAAVTISVHVTMPASGVYLGERVGPQLTYAAAHTTGLSFTATPYLDFTENLGAGEAVQYILAPTFSYSVAQAPYEEMFGVIPLRPVFSPGDSIVIDSANVIISAVNAVNIYYTTDGSTPNRNSAHYTSAIKVTATTTITARAYSANFVDSGDVTSTNFNILHRIAKPATGGLNYKYFEYEGAVWDSLKDLGALTPKKSGMVDSFHLGMRDRNYKFAVRFTGAITLPTDGQYTFTLYSDAGSKFYLDHTCLINNDGPHALSSGKSVMVQLKQGVYPLYLDYFQDTLALGLILYYQGPGIAQTRIPHAALFCDSSASRVQAPAAQPKLAPLLRICSLQNSIISITVPVAAPYQVSILRADGAAVKKIASDKPAVYNFSRKALSPGVYLVTLTSGPMKYSKMMLVY